MGSSGSTQVSGRGENDPSKAEDLARKKKIEEMVKIVAGVVTGAALVGSLIYKLASASGEKEEEEVVKKKMMKAPGRSGSYIPRDEFQEAPAAYFRNLHKDKKSTT